MASLEDLNNQFQSLQKTIKEQQEKINSLEKQLSEYRADILDTENNLNEQISQNNEQLNQNLATFLNQNLATFQEQIKNEINKIGWNLVYAHDAQGVKTFGDLNTLIAKIEQGAKVRVLLKPYDSNDKNFSCCDADYVWVQDGVVFAQNTQHICVDFHTPKDNKQVMFQSDSYHWFLMVNTNGYVDMIRWQVGEHTPRGHNQERRAIKWFVG